MKYSTLYRALGSSVRLRLAMLSLLSLTLLASTPGWGQLAYLASVNTGTTYAPITTPTGVLWSGSYATNAISTAIDLTTGGFPKAFFNGTTSGTNDYQYAFVTTNGFIQLRQTNTATLTSFTTSPGSVATLLYPFGSGTLSPSTVTAGVNPRGVAASPRISYLNTNTQFIVDFQDVARNGFAATEMISAQAILTKSTGKITYTYKFDLIGAPNTVAGSKLFIGVSNGSGASSSTNIAVSPGGTNQETWATPNLVSVTTTAQASLSVAYTGTSMSFLNIPAYGTDANYNKTAFDFDWSSNSPCNSPAGTLTFTASTTVAALSASIASANYNWEIRTYGLPGSGSAGLFNSGSTSGSFSVNNATINGGTNGTMKPGVLYNAYVRTNCTSTSAGQAGWTAFTPATITTTCTGGAAGSQAWANNNVGPPAGVGTTGVNTTNNPVFQFTNNVGATTSGYDVAINVIGKGPFDSPIYTTYVAGTASATMSTVTVPPANLTAGVYKGYAMWVRRSCPNLTPSSVGTYAIGSLSNNGFTAGCTSAKSTLDISEDFNTANLPQPVNNSVNLASITPNNLYPSCFTAEVSNAGGIALPTVGSSTSGGNGNAPCMTGTISLGTAAYSAYLFLPPVTLANGDKINISYFGKASAYTGSNLTPTSQLFYGTSATGVQTASVVTTALGTKQTLTSNAYNGSAYTTSFQNTTGSSNTFVFAIRTRLDGGGSGSGTGSYFYDDISMVKVVCAGAPTTLATANLTSSSVDLTWDENLGATSGYTYQVAVNGGAYGSALTVPGGAGLASGTRTLTLSISGCSAYSVKVFANCPAGSASSTITFNSPGPVALPYSETYDGIGQSATTGGIGVFPGTCYTITGTAGVWGTVYGTSSGSTPNNRVDRVPYSSTNMLVANAGTASSGTVWLPPVTVANGDQLKFSFRMMSYGANNGWTITPIYNATPTTVGATNLTLAEYIPFSTSVLSSVTTPIVNFQNPAYTYSSSTKGYALFGMSTGVLTAGTYSFGITASSATSGPFQMYFDDLSIVKTPCGDYPKNISTSLVAFNQAIVTWTANGSSVSTGYDYEINTTGTFTGTPTANVAGGNTAQVTINSLAANQTYFIRFRSTCAGGPSGWSPSFGFTTPCVGTLPFNYSNGESSPYNGESGTIDPCFQVTQTQLGSTASTLTSVAYGAVFLPSAVGTNVLAVNSGTTTTNTNTLRLALRQFDFATGSITPQIGFNFYHSIGIGETSGSFAADKVDVQYSTNGGTTWTTVQSINRYNGTTGWEAISIELPGLASQPYGMIALFFSIKGGKDMFVDAINISQVICGGVPKNVVAAVATSTSTTFSWDVNAAADQGFDYAISTDGGTTYSSLIGVAAGTYSVTLTTVPGITYFVKVRAKCSSGFTGYSTISYNTPCANITLPLSEGFENSYKTQATANTVPTDCWKLIKVSGTGTTAGFFTTANSRTGSAAFSTYDANNHILWLPKLTVAAGNLYQLSFWGKNVLNSGTVTNTVSVVKDATQSTFPATTVATFNLTGSTVLSYQQYSGTYLAASTGDIYLGIQISRTNGAEYFYIDDISLAQVNCAAAPVATYTSGSNTPSTAGFSIASAVTPTPANFDYAVVLRGASPTTVSGTVVSTGIFPKSFTVSALLPSTQYDLYIRSHCAAGSSAWSAIPVQFQTECAAQAVPYSLDFETTQCYSTEVVSTWPSGFDPTVQLYTDNTKFSPGVGNKLASGGNKFLYFNSANPSMTVGTQYRVISPQLNYTGKRPEVSFWMYTNQLASQVNLQGIQLEWSTTGLAGSWQLATSPSVRASQYAVANGWVQFTLPITAAGAYNQPVLYIALNITGQQGPDQYFDNIVFGAATVLADQVWTGAAGSGGVGQWSNDKNWLYYRGTTTGANVPTTTDKVYFPATANVATTTAGTSIKDAVFGNGASISIPSFGPLSITNSLTVTAPTNAVTFTGAGGLTFSGTQTLPGILTANTDITIPGSVTIGSGAELRIAPGRTLNVGSTGVVTTTGKLVLQSDIVSGAGRIGQISGTASISGTNVFVERALPVVGWHFIGIPLAGKFISDLPTARIAPINNSNLFYHSESDSTTQKANGSNTGINGWKVPTTPASSTALTGTAWRFWTGSNIPKYTLSGAINSGPITSGTINRTAGVGTSYEGSGPGWNLLGNPYPSEIDWNAFYSANSGTLNDIVQIWNPALNSNTGGYSTYSQASGTGTSGGSRYIASSQGFFVRKTGNGAGTVSYAENQKAIAGTNTYLREAMDSYTMRITLNHGANADQSVIAFREVGFNGRDKFDGDKLANSVLNVSTAPKPNLDFVQNIMAPLKGHLEIPIKVSTTLRGDHTLSFEGIETFDASTSIYLKDAFTNTLTNLTLGTTYTFSVSNDPATQGVKRLSIVFDPSGVTEVKPNAKASMSVWPNPASGATKLNVSLANLGSTTGTVALMDALGRTVATQTLDWSDKDAVATFSLEGIPAGVYVVKATSVSATLTQEVVIK